MITTAMSVVMGSKGAVSYSEVMDMELARFFEVVKAINISNSAQRQAEFAQENHTRAMNGSR